MKLKQSPDDFFVEELSALQPAAEGEFALYRLEKRGWTTPDALQAIRRRWKLDARRVSFGGLKDRHAHTIQHFTVWHGPQRQLSQQGVHVQYLGRACEPFQSVHIRANRFRLVLRDLSASEAARAQGALPTLARDGVPNYFDDQRFGSGDAGQFMAKSLVHGDFEQALRLALTTPYEHDRAAPKREKAALKAHWGDWARCRGVLPPGNARSLADYLAQHPGDYRGAVARLRPELRGLYLSAYQSHLWNRMLARWLRERLRPDQLAEIELKTGELPFHIGLEDAQRAQLSALELPFATARGTVEPEDPGARVMQAVLEEEGLRREQLKVPGLREVFFSRGERAALCVPAELHGEIGDDENNEGQTKLTLSFVLPRGCYATLVVKRLFVGG
jgi:tRNA pseudouridine13 synthase